jgi:transcriptional regulator with XRE-family HTH domain
MGIADRSVKLDALSITQGFFSATNYFGLSAADIAKLLGVSEATISRAKKSDSYFKPSRPHQWATAELFMRLHRAIQSSFCRPRRGKLWLFYFSHQLGACPIDLIFSFEGLIEVVNFAEERARESKLSRYQLFFAREISLKEVEAGS